MKKLIYALTVAFLIGCAEGGKNDQQINGNNIYPSCSGLTLVARSTTNPTQKLIGYVNNVLAFDECSGSANGFTFTRSSQPINGYYEATLSNPSFPYPQPSNQVTLKVDVRLYCGGGVIQSASRSIPLEDRGGCYFASFTQ